MPRTATSSVDAKLLGSRIRAVRAADGLTQAELAARLGVSPAYVQKLEAGRANPTVGQLATVARALGRTLELGFSEPIAPHDPLAEFAAR